jgi:hypothetical protein
MPSYIRRALTTAMAFLLIAGAALWLLDNASPTPPSADLGGFGNQIAGASPAMAADAEGTRIQDSTFQPRTKIQTRRLRIVDASTNLPVPGCSILPFNPHLVCSSKTDFESSRIAISDAEGLCSFDAEGKVCACHAKYQAQVVAPPHDQVAPQIVRLHPGLQVSIECRLGDQAVAGVNIALSAVGLRGINLRQDGLHTAVALDANQGIHFAQTDRRGIATFSALSDIPYCVFCLSPEYCILTELGPGGPLMVRPPGYIITAMGSVVVVRASMPSNTKAVLHGITIPRSGFDRHGTLSKVALAHFPELRNEFWQARAATAESDDQSETLRVLTSMGSWATTTLYYQPVLSSRPQILEGIATVSQATYPVQIEARDARNRQIPIPLRIAEISSGSKLTATTTLDSGFTISLPNGTYAVWAHDRARQWFKKVEFRVPEDDSHVVLASTEILSGLSVQARAQSGLAITDWICDIRHAKQRPFQYPVQGHDTAHLWLPEGEFELRVNSPGMTQVKTTVSLYETDPTASPRTITLTMQEQDGGRR